MIKKSCIHILLFVKSNFHEMLLIKEIQSRIQEVVITPIKSISEAIDILESTDVHALVIDLHRENQNDLKNVHELHTIKPVLPMIAVVDDNDESYVRELFKLGVSEILQKNETFYVVIPKLLKSVISQERSDFLEISQNESDTEHVKLTSRTLSHEINNPLMTILGVAELILENQEEYDKDLVNKIKTIQKSAYRIQKSTHRMSYIKSPVYQKTPYGVIIDPNKSRISTKSKVKLSETE